MLGDDWSNFFRQNPVTRLASQKRSEVSTLVIIAGLTKLSPRAPDMLRMAADHLNTFIFLRWVWPACFIGKCVAGA